jgi:hypothetical protein
VKRLINWALLIGLMIIASLISDTVLAAVWVLLGYMLCAVFFISMAYERKFESRRRTVEFMREMNTPK